MIRSPSPPRVPVSISRRVRVTTLVMIAGHDYPFDGGSGTAVHASVGRHVRHRHSHRYRYRRNHHVWLGDPPKAQEEENALDQSVLDEFFHRHPDVIP